MHTEMAMQDAREFRSRQIRFRLYWMSASLATLVFLTFTYVMAMVPGIYKGQKLWMFAIEISLLIVSLGLGTWGFKTREVPFTTGRLGLVVGVVLILEIAECIIGVFQVAATTHR